MPPFATVRVRTTAMAVAIVGAGLAVGGAGLLFLLQRNLVANAQDAARLRAADVAAQVQRGPLPDRLPEGGDEASAVQVADAEGRVVATSPSIRTTRPLIGERPPPGRRVARTLRHPPVGDGAAYRVVALGVDSPVGPIVIYAASSLEAAEESVHTVTVLLVVGLPVVLLLVGLTAWRLVGRTLDPVEEIRREVAAISAAGLDRRVPEPAVADEVGRLARTMNEMLERLESASRRQQAFVADASHELRSPLSTIRARLETAQRHPNRVEWGRLVDQLLEEQGRVEQLVENLLLLARSDEGAPLERRVVDLDEVVLREVEARRSTARVPVDLSGVGGGRVTGDPEQLGRVVGNLLDNAQRHAASRVAVGLTSRNGTVELSVTDDGAGIPAPDRERVFERFTRLDDARSRDRGGAGLGLAIVREVVTAHGGTVAVEDAAGSGGVRFLFRLPASERFDPT